MRFFSVTVTIHIKIYQLHEYFVTSVRAPIVKAPLCPRFTSKDIVKIALQTKELNIAEKKVPRKKFETSPN